MKKLISKISLFAVLFPAFFIPGKAKAGSKASISGRANLIRSKIYKEVKNGTLLELTGKDFADKGLKSWVNWGNWGNWNNWNNWANWANWSNWANWANK